MILDDPSLDGVAAVLFDEFHERSLDADLGLALALDAQAALRPDLRLLVMSATLDGARVAALMRRRAGHRIAGPRLSGRNPSISAAIRAKRSSEAGFRAILAGPWPKQPGSILVFLPGQAEIPRLAGAARRKTARSGRRCLPALRRDGARRRRTAPYAGGAGRPAQDRAGDLDRRNLDHHRRRARGHRLRPRPRAALRARSRPDPARNPARVARRRRPAPRPRRPHRARRLLPPVGGGGDRRPARLRPAGNPRRRSFRPAARPRRLGRARPGRTGLARSAARPRRAPRRARLLQELGALDAEGAITPRGKAMRGLPLPPRLARMVLAGRISSAPASRPASSPWS